jgi:putative tryptophan/tyrosine transport system substrate-binding protein
MQFDQLKRREFIGLLGGATAAWPLTARAQQVDRMRRIGLLIQFAESDPNGQARVAAFREGLQKLGWRIGDNLRIDYHWGTSNDERARAAAAELLKKMAPDVIFANSSVDNGLVALSRQAQPAATPRPRMPCTFNPWRTSAA